MSPALGVSPLQKRQSKGESNVTWLDGEIVAESRARPYCARGQHRNCTPASANREASLPIVPDPTQVKCPSAVNAVARLKNWNDPRYDANYAAHETN